MLTLDTGASHSIIKAGLVKKEVKPLIGAKLRTATGEEALLIGELTCDVTIGNVKVSHVFIVADIADEVIIGVDFLTDHGISIDLRSMTMTINNMEVRLNSGYDESHRVREALLVDSQQIPPMSEAVIWAKINADWGVNQLWLIEAAENSTPDVLIAKTLAKSNPDGRIPVRVLNEFKSPIKLFKGALLAECHEVEAIINCEAVPENQRVDVSKMHKEIDDWTKGLEPLEAEKAKQLLRKYCGIFDKNGSKPGRTNIVKHRIYTGDAMPIRQPPRSLPLAKREVVSQIIHDMSESGVIEPSASPWCSPVVLVKKKERCGSALIIVNLTM
ncbi:uncharacterized protein LOC118745073 [Rhagoletis pomonella]|uniref:uncharacterized protein LOC118745073 n=1 Tax=Rhagoletis pomonella TaxID=28610 RepID=UPI001786B69D|nr:uncharacterized protein LOC118745073 [Rhagoletis pomonella]